VFNIFAKLVEGGFIFVTCREELEQAVQLVQELKASWPHEYVLRDSQGNDVDLKNPTP
jgi:hypothetical protein